MNDGEQGWSRSAGWVQPLHAVVGWFAGSIVVYGAARWSFDPVVAERTDWPVYPLWLVEAATFGAVGDRGGFSAGELVSRWVITLLPVAVALAIAGVVSVGLTRLARRSAAADRLVGVLSGAITGVTPILFALAVFELARRTGQPLFVRAGFRDDPGLYLRSLGLAVIALTPAALPVTIGWLRPHGGSTLPERVEQVGLGTTSGFGVPIRSLVLAVFSVEVILGRPGIWFTLRDSIFAFSSRQVTVLGQIVLLTLVVVVGAAVIRMITSSSEPPASEARGPMSPGATVEAGRTTGWFGLALAAPTALLVVAMVGAGLLIDGETVRPAGANLGLFEDGHLLGTDRLGRDVLARLGLGLGRDLIVALVVGGVASVLGFVVAWIGRQVGRAAHLTIGTPLELLAWPVWLVLLFALILWSWPVLLLALVAMSVPVGVRMHLHGRAGPLAAIPGVALLLAGWVFATLAVAGLVVGGTPGAPGETGRNVVVGLTESFGGATGSAWLAVGVIAMAGLMLRSAGAGLLALGRSADRASSLQQPVGPVDEGSERRWTPDPAWAPPAAGGDGRPNPAAQTPPMPPRPDRSPASPPMPPTPPVPPKPPLPSNPPMPPMAP